MSLSGPENGIDMACCCGRHSGGQEHLSANVVTEMAIAFIIVENYEMGKD